MTEKYNRYKALWLENKTEQGFEDFFWKNIADKNI